MMGTHGLMVAVVPALLRLEKLHFSSEDLSFVHGEDTLDADTANLTILFHAAPPIDSQLEWRRVRKQERRCLPEQKTSR